MHNLLARKPVIERIAHPGDVTHRSCWDIHIPVSTNQLKIGCTTRTVLERVDERNGATGLPAPFLIEAVFPSTAPPYPLSRRAQSSKEGEFPSVSIAVPRRVKKLSSAVNACK